ncbi:M24 family metallopeptidase [Maledivibacter halophilus]|uniref:Xaa-Pro aminopeptidase n=1 Tax=Maledivibacter halophilus TaxID=36842 RepID=A0A1T5IC04_9FIRM|nr:Xaa-Pro peptidase family protein [Maledivibacter halophilus]SKC36679.1 Xaa-Pro aminopeptidase [Maledivibacter halophilus]
MDNLYLEKLQQAEKYLKDCDIDLWLIYSSEGSDPCIPLITGLKTVGKTFFLITKEGKKYAIASVIDAQESQNSGLFDEVYIYSSDCEKLLREVIDKINPGKIAINYSMDDNLCDGLTAGRYRWLIKALGDNYVDKIIQSEVFLKKLRSVKTPTEIERIQKAIDITLDIYDEVTKNLKVGLSEYEVGKMFVEGMKKRGVVNGNTKKLTMPMVLKERIAHREPGNAVIKPGDFMIVDFSVDYKGYVSDIARTFYFLKEGETRAPEIMQKRFEAVYEAITLVKENIKPGKKGYELDSLAREHLLNRGMPEITHATGHQVGRFTHDGGTLLGPQWERYGKGPNETIEAGMIFTIEPTILFNDGDYSILTEEIILVGKEKTVFMSNRQKNVFLI